MNIKGWLRGIHHHCSKERMQGYLNEYHFRYNRRQAIKEVLPALVPELTYTSLEIGNGGDASAAFYNLQYEKDESVVKKTREALLKYCELDTIAMVRILEKIGPLKS